MVKHVELTPDQERRIDAEVDQGVGNYGEIMAKYAGVEVLLLEESEKADYPQPPEGPRGDKNSHVNKRTALYRRIEAGRFPGEDPLVR